MASHNNYVLITGATSGIGLELAKLFAKDGYQLVLVSKDKEKLERVQKDFTKNYGIQPEIFTIDLVSPTAPQEIFIEMQKRNVSVDILVNNAGVGVYGDFKNTNLGQELAMIQINITALTALTKLFLPQMIERRSGKILNLASTAAFQPGPAMAAYFATKAYVLSFSEAIREELRGTGVSVTTLCPGPTKTNFDMNAGASKSKLFRSPGVMDAATVARIGYKGLLKNRQTIVTGFKNTFLIFLLRITPRSIVPRIVRLLQSE